MYFSKRVPGEFLSNPNATRTLSKQKIKAFFLKIQTLAVSSDGQSIFFAGEDKAIRIVSPSGKELKVLKGHPDPVCFPFTPPLVCRLIF